MDTDAGAYVDVFDYQVEEPFERHNGWRIRRVLMHNDPYSIHASKGQDWVPVYGGVLVHAYINGDEQRAINLVRKRIDEIESGTYDTHLRHS